MSHAPLLIATRSADKLREIRAILAGAGCGPVIGLTEAGIPPAPAEDGLEEFDTFTGNALAKARYFAALSALPTLADDSGLCVDALGGAPGVWSKRFSGRTDLGGAALDAANNQHLLERLHGVPAAERAAHYVCAVALVGPGGEEGHFEGRCDGRILTAPRGSGGFGYDPLFEVAGQGLTFAELPAGVKNTISHRARAFQQLARALR